MRLARFAIFALGISLIPMVVSASEPEIGTDIIDDALVAQVREWVETPVVAMTLEAQNARYADLDQSAIDALDQQWRAETEKDDQPLIAATLSSPLSNYLLQIQAGSLGLYSEIFVMDANGLSAGQSAITSDFWQGDEDKFLKTYPEGPDAVFIDVAEYNDGTGTWRAQINMTVVDDQGRPTGAVTVEVNLTELARRQALGI